MNDTQRALADCLLDFVVSRRLAGHRLTERERLLVVAVALELGMDIHIDAR